MHQSVADSLGRRIASGDLETSSLLSLAGIEAEYEVSRTVSREAMRLLESVGMLKAKRRVGLTVTAPSEWDVLNPRVIGWRLDGPGRDAQLRTLMEVRVAVEPTAARLAAAHATDAERAELVRLASELTDLGSRRLGTSEEYLRTDVAFHQTLLRASRNEMLAALDDVVEALLVGRTRLGLSPAAPIPEVLDHHAATARAVHAQLPEAAEVCCRALVDRVRHEFAWVEFADRGAGVAGEAGRTRRDPGSAL